MSEEEIRKATRPYVEALFPFLTIGKHHQLMELLLSPNQTAKIEFLGGSPTKADLERLIQLLQMQAKWAPETIKQPLTIDEVTTAITDAATTGATK